MGTSSLYLCLGGDLGVHHCLQQLLWMHPSMLLVPPIQLSALLQRWRLVLVPGTSHVNVQLDIAAYISCGVSVGVHGLGPIHNLAHIPLWSTFTNFLFVDNGHQLGQQVHKPLKGSNLCLAHKPVKVDDFLLCNQRRAGRQPVCLVCCWPPRHTITSATTAQHAQGNGLIATCASEWPE